MTALVASLGFVPMAIATGAGAEVQRPLAPRCEWIVEQLNAGSFAKITRDARQGRAALLDPSSARFYVKRYRRLRESGSCERNDAAYFADCGWPKGKGG